MMTGKYDALSHTMLCETNYIGRSSYQTVFVMGPDKSNILGVEL